MSFSIVKSNIKNRYNKTEKSERGFWEYSRFQKNENDINEQYLKSRCPVGKFDHLKIKGMMYPEKSKEELLMDKYNNGEKLRSDEKIIVQNIIEKNNKDIENDIKKINKFKLNATDIKTDEGRIRKLFLVAKSKIDEGDDEMLYYVKMKLEEFELSDSIKNEYKDIINEIDNICCDIDKIKLQFNRFHSNMPPLNKTGFTSLDDFQKDVIRNIDNNISTIVQAPTSSGKSILTGYLYTKENMKALVVVPTDILAWQMASMIGRITKNDIPIITESFQSSPKRDVLLEKINRVGIVVGTPQYLLDFLPLINVKFNWLVMDEIHMIGHKSCYEMEMIAKAYSDLNILALSATIGNVEELKDWFIKIGFNNIQVVKCDKRFFNLQQYYYSNKMINRIHPLSMVNINDFLDKSILTKNINITPPDIWDLAIKLFKKNNKLSPYQYFDKEQRITLDQANEYFNKMIEYMVSMDKKDIIKILSSYNNINIEDKKERLINLAFTLKRENKTPAIIFNTNTFNCLELVKQFSKDIKLLENKKYPDLYRERLKLQSRARSLNKKMDKMKLDEVGDKKQSKMLMKGEIDMFNSNNINISINEPHIDFIFNKHQKVTQHHVDGWNKELNKYFPADGVEYNYIIDLLWRGVGVYVKGLPDPYLRIVQNMACDGDLAIVFSDESLVFGVSMPFRTTVITDDNINSLIYHQMAGRAGRRGLDKEGNVVFINNSFDRIKELSTSSIPHIEGYKYKQYGVDIAYKLSNNPNYLKLKDNFLNSNSCNIDTTNELEFLNSNDLDLNHMLWKLRQSEDMYKVLFLLTFIRRIFSNCNPDNEKTQIDFSQFILSYIYPLNINSENILEELPESKKFNIIDNFNKMNIIINHNNYKLYECIRMNKLNDNYQLREHLIEFSDMIKHIQHYFYHKKEISITRLLGKLLTRIWWIYHSSSPIMN